MDDPSYTLHLKQTLTIKPHEFYIHAIPRKGKSAIPFSASSLSVPPPLAQSQEAVLAAAPAQGGKKPMHVLYGSNTGTCESFAQQIAAASSKYGTQK